MLLGRSWGGDHTYIYIYNDLILKHGNPQKDRTAFPVLGVAIDGFLMKY